MSDDRKYKHHGYQDGGGYSSHSSNNNGNHRPQGPRPEPGRGRLEGAPRGRTAGGFGPEVFKCNACGHQRIGLEQPTPDETCMKCGADLHTCSNCIHFDTSVHWECRKNAEIPARIAKKRDRNDCALFTPKLAQEFAKDAAKGSPGDARSAFDALFKF